MGLPLFGLKPNEPISRQSPVVAFHTARDQENYDIEALQDMQSRIALLDNAIIKLERLERGVFIEKTQLVAAHLAASTKGIEIDMLLEELAWHLRCREQGGDITVVGRGLAVVEAHLEASRQDLHKWQRRIYLCQIRLDRKQNDLAKERVLCARVQRETDGYNGGLLLAAGPVSTRPSSPSHFWQPGPGLTESTIAG